MGFFSDMNPFKFKKEESKEKQETGYRKVLKDQEKETENFNRDQIKAEKWFFSLAEEEKDILKKNASSFASKLIFSKKGTREIYLYLFMVLLLGVSAATMLTENVFVGILGGIILFIDWSIFKRFDFKSRKGLKFTDPLSSIIIVAIYRLVLEEKTPETEEETVLGENPTEY